MPLTVKIERDGRAEIIRDDGSNPGGEPAMSRWNVPPGQIGAHLATFEGELRAGDRDALRDVAREVERKRERGEG